VSTRENFLRPPALLELRVLGLGFFQDGDEGVGLFPEGKEVFVGGESPDAGGVGIPSLRRSRLQGVGTRHSQVRQRSRPADPDDTAVVAALPFPAAKYVSPRTYTG